MIRIIHYKYKNKVFMYIGMITDEEILQKCKKNKWAVLSVKNI